MSGKPGEAPTAGAEGPAAAALLGSDLLMASRLGAALSSRGVALFRGADAAAPPSAPVVFVDLNSRIDERIDAISRIRGRDARALVVGFCDHDAAEVRRRAMAAGASQVVANRHLAEAALRLLGAGSPSEGG
jgi:DNA-binding NarL/FixJ family response regulator